MLFHSGVYNAVDYGQPLSFLTDVLCKVEPSNLWYHYVASTVIILAIAFYFSQMLSTNKIVEKNGFLPAFLLILSASLFSDFNFISNELIAFVLVFISVIILYNTLLNDSKHSGLFDAAFFMGIGAMIYNPIFLLFFTVLASIILLRTVQLRDLLITIIGFFVPVFLVGTYCFMIGRLSLFCSHLLPSMTVDFQLINKGEVWEYIKLILFGIFVVLGVLKGQAESGKTIVTVRKFYSISLLLVIGIALSLFFSGTLKVTAFIYFSIPFSFYLYTSVKDLKRIWIAELIHVILIGLIFFTSI